MEHIEKFSDLINPSNFNAAELDADNNRLAQDILTLERELIDARLLVAKKLQINTERRKKVVELQARIAQLSKEPVGAIAESASQAGGDSD